MNNIKLGFHVLVIAIVGHTVACGGTGSVSIDGEIPNQRLELSTAFAWVDALHVRSSTGGYEMNDSPTMYIMLSGAAFEPESDLRFTDPAEVERIAHDERNRGSVRLRIRAAKLVRAGQTLTDPPEPGAAGEGEPRLDAQIEFGREELAGDATYPDAPIPQLASTRRLVLKLDNYGTEPGDTVAGTATYTITSAEHDPPGATTGELSIDFSAPLIHERIAESNFGGRN